jgi:hypothetical protein
MQRNSSISHRSSAGGNGTSRRRQKQVDFNVARPSEKSSKHHHHRTTMSSTSSASANSTGATTSRTIALFGCGSKTCLPFLRLALDAGYRVQALLVTTSSSSTCSSRQEPARFSKREESVADGIAKGLLEEFRDTLNLEWIRSESIYDPVAIRAALCNAEYVVCMMNPTETPLYAAVERTSGGTGAQAVVSSSISGTRAATKRSSSATKDNQGNRTSSLITAADPKKPLTSFLRVLYPLMKEEPSIQVFLYQVRFAILCNGSISEPY